MGLVAVSFTLFFILSAVTGWSIDDYCYSTSDHYTEPAPRSRPCGRLTGNSINTTNETIFPRNLTSLNASEGLQNTLLQSETCYDESSLGGVCGSRYIFEDDCALFGLGNHQFKICNGLHYYAMQCNVTRLHQYRYQVIGSNGFDQSGCIGSDCQQQYCERPDRGVIIFSTATEPDALMVLSTRHRIRYHVQMRVALEREGFLT